MARPKGRGKCGDHRERHFVRDETDQGHRQPDGGRRGCDAGEQTRPCFEMSAVDDAVHAGRRERIAQIHQGDDQREQRVFVGGEDPRENEVGSREPEARRCVDRHAAQRGRGPILLHALAPATLASMSS